MSKSSRRSQSSTGGASIGTVIQIVFIVLKVLEIEPVNQWSWWWVMSPMWISICICCVVLVGIYAWDKEFREAINEAAKSVWNRKRV